MAKSLRSKRARKMRAIKRIRYGAKELARLQEMIKNSEAEKQELESSGFKLVSPPLASGQLQPPPSPLTRLPPETGSGESSAAAVEENVAEMEEEVKGTNPKTMRDEKGNYPVWFNQKRIKRIQRARKRKAGKRKRKQH